MMNIKNIKLTWIKALMLSCQALLLIFAAQWVTSQYNEQQEQLKKNLTRIFTDVQHKITDSLLLTQVIDPVGQNKQQPLYLTDEHGVKITLSAQGLHRVLAGATNISHSEEKILFSMDTMRFNELFLSEMKQNGWNFHSEWINSSDSGTRATKAIFIQSSFFTDQNGIVVNNYWWYLFKKILPQIFFIAILLLLTAFAFIIALKSLKAQIKLSGLKDDFINNMSHELKTPIATVKVALEALGTFNIIEDPKLSREYLGMARAEMDRLELMATHVLNTSLLEAGRIYMQQEQCDLKQLVEEVLQTMHLKFRQQKARVSFDARGSTFLMPLDKLHIRGVLVNLLDNSMKYALSPVHIDIHLSESGGKMQLAVTDNGPGIPTEYYDKVFEKFFRVPSGNRHNAKGYGLGLSYAAQVMRQHNGNIRVNNIISGGCVFTLVF